MKENSLFPWYSSLATDIVEIDMQHGNIDMLIHMLDKSPKTEINLVEQILKTLENHITYEEHLLDKQFPSDHHRAHSDLLSFFRFEEIELRTKVIAKDFFIRVLRNKLKEHVEEFDSKLKELIEKTETPQKLTHHNAPEPQ